MIVKFVKLLTTVIIFGGACTASAAQPFNRLPTPSEKKHMAYLQVQRMMTRTGGQTTWWTDYGSYERNYSRAVGIQINVRNMGLTEDEFAVEWYFIAKQFGGKQFSIFDQGSKLITLKAGESANAAVASKTLEASDNTYVMLGERKIAGSKLEGFAVLVKAGEETIASYYSMQHLEKVLQSLLKTPVQ